MCCSKVRQGSKTKARREWKNMMHNSSARTCSYLDMSPYMKRLRKLPPSQACLRVHIHFITAHQKTDSNCSNSIERKPNFSQRFMRRTWCLDNISKNINSTQNAPREMQIELHPFSPSLYFLPSQFHAKCPSTNYMIEQFALYNFFSYITSKHQWLHRLVSQTSPKFNIQKSKGQRTSTFLNHASKVSFATKLS